MVENKPIYKKWWFWAIVVVALILIFALIGGWKPEQQPASNEQNTSESNTTESTISESSESTTNEIGGHILTQDEAEEKCQDAGIIGNYLDLSKISIVSILNYNPQFVAEASGYDQDKNSIALFRWNGKDKDTDEQITFICWVSGTDSDNITIHNLAMSEGDTRLDLIGTQGFASYDKEGNLNE